MSHSVTAEALTPAPPTVLVIDDDEDILEATTLLLESEGYQVTTAHDGGEALDKLAREPHPTVILLDLMMPGMNGFEFYGRLRQLPGPARKLPVIVVSATRDARRLAANLGAEACLPKPYELQALIDQIAAVVQRPQS